MPRINKGREICISGLKLALQPFPHIKDCMRRVYLRTHLHQGFRTALIGGAKRVVKRRTCIHSGHVELCAQFIDAEWFCRAHRLPAMSRADAARYYLENWTVQKLVPHPLFNPWHFAGQISAVYRSALNPYVFYLQNGASYMLTETCGEVSETWRAAEFERLAALDRSCRPAQLAVATCPRLPPSSVTVLVRTTFNRPRLLTRALRSVLIRDERHPVQVEVLVLHSSRVDRLAAQYQSGLLEADISRHTPTTIRFISVQGEHRSSLLNAGLERSTGDYLCILDDDDALYPNYFGEALKHLTSNRAVDAVYMASDVIHCVGDDDRSAEFNSGYVHFSVIWSWMRLRQRNLFPIQSVVAKAKAIRSFRFSQTVDALEDWLFWLEALYGREVVGIPARTSMYRVPIPGGAEALQRQNYHEKYRPVLDRVFEMKGIPRPAPPDNERLAIRAPNMPCGN